jgi:hypothetical protein
MSSSEIKTSNAATPREMALAQIKEADKMINEAGGPSCVSGGLSILRGALLYVARNNTLSNTVPSIVSVLRDTSLALTMGPVTEAYSEYSGAITDIQIPIGSEGEPKNIFLALPTAENAIVNFQHTDSVHTGKLANGETDSNHPTPEQTRTVHSILQEGTRNPLELKKPIAKNDHGM